VQTTHALPVRADLWSAQDDIQASLALGQATLAALCALAPSVDATGEAGLSEIFAAAARSDRDATQRVADILQDMRDRLQGALAQARMEGDLERAIIAAAARLPGNHLEEDAQPMRAAS